MREEMGKQAIKIAEEQFDRPESYNKIVELIRELTEKKVRNQYLVLKFRQIKPRNILQTSYHPLESRLFQIGNVLW